MDAYEIPLVIFTVFLQWSVGIIIAIVLLEWLKPKFMETVGKEGLKTPIYIALGVSVIGTIASLFHLGAPLKAVTSITGISHSWLSREIVAVVIFNLFLLILTYIWWKKEDQASVRKGLGTFTALLGVIAVIFSGMVYFTMELHPAWNNWTTFANFLLTGLLLGALTVTYFALKKGTEDTAEQNVLKVLGIYLGIVVAALLITIGSTFLSATGAIEAETAAAISVTSVLFWVRVFSSLLIPATLIIYFVVAKKVKVVNYVLIATAFVLIGELSGRAMFYYSVMSQYPWF